MFQYSFSFISVQPHISCSGSLDIQTQLPAAHNCQLWWCLWFSCSGILWKTWAWDPIQTSSNLQPRKRPDIPEMSSSQLPQGDSPPEGPSPELESEDNESLYATDRDTHPRLWSPSSDPLNIGKMLINAMQIDTLSTYKQAMRSPLKNKWQEATRDEYNSLTEMGTWILVSPPKNWNMIKCKWVFMVKANGCYKAWLIGKGFTQEHGIDYEETFSPVTRYKSIHYLLAHAALEDW